MILGFQGLIWRKYITVKTLLITKRVILIELKEFVLAVLTKKVKTFMVHMTVLLTMYIDLNKKAQIRVWIAKQFFSEVSAD